MKGIQVSIDVSESEIVPKAFQRAWCQGSGLAVPLPVCVLWPPGAKKKEKNLNTIRAVHQGSPLRNHEKRVKIFQTKKGASSIPHVSKEHHYNLGRFFFFFFLSLRR